jgi:hypothetical protein
MPKSLQFTLMVVSVLVFWGRIVALASPVTDADLRGKKICWYSKGVINTYGKDGSLESNLLGHGKWRLVGDKLTENGLHDYTFTITKEGGTFHMTNREVGEVWGRYCAWGKMTR